MQWLVRFQDRTHPVEAEDPKASLGILSDRTGWPLHRLRLVAVNEPFLHVSTVSCLRGGKGGFGTLLKSSRGGGSGTTNMGACRDLQGRRLSSVNDSLAREQYAAWQDKIARGVATEEDMVQALIQSGIPGWFLPAKSVGKKQQRTLQRQFRTWKRERAAQKEAQQRAKDMKERHAQSYVDAAVRESQEASRVLQSAFDGFKKKQEAPVDDETSSSLMTLSGDVVVEDDWKVQSQSNFGTVGVVLAQELGQHPLYWEAVVVKGGLVQLGWAASGFTPNSEEGTGAGDDALSWAYDGSRSIRLHNDSSEAYGREWTAGDVVGCRLDPTSGELSYSLNGADLGVAYIITSEDRVLFPVVSCNPQEIVELRVHKADLKHQPEGTVSVGSLLSETESTEAPLKSPVVVESQTEEPPAAPEPTPIEPLNLDEYESAEALEALGLDRLKSACIAIEVKCGGTLQERAQRLWSLKGLDPSEYPEKLRAKKKQRKS